MADPNSGGSDLVFNRTRGKFIARRRKNNPERRSNQVSAVTDLKRGAVVREEEREGTNLSHYNFG